MSIWLFIRTLLILLFDAIVLQPPKVVIALLMRVLWRPTYQMDLLREHMSTEPENVEPLRVADAPIDTLENDGDGLKWLGLLAAGGHKKAWKAILNRVGTLGGIYRYPILDERNYEAPAVSGDMASGVVLAVARLIKRGAPYDKLAGMFRNIVYRGFSFPGNNTADVGRIYQFFALTPTYKQCLVWLEIACRLNPGNKVLSFWRGFFKIMFAPILAVNLIDYNIWIGRLVALAWYVPHSQYLFNLAGYELTGEKMYARALELLREKYPWNADFKDRRNVLHDMADAKGTEVYTGPMRTVFSLRSLEKKEMALEVLPPSMTGQKYVFENDPFKPKTCSESRRDEWPYDSLAPHLPR